MNLQIILQVQVILYIMELVHSILVMEQLMNGMLMSDLPLNLLVTFLIIVNTTAITIKETLHIKTKAPLWAGLWFIIRVRL